MGYTELRSEQLSRFEKGRDTVIIRKVHNEKSDSIDIREYYTSESGELLPTKKGIRFNCEVTLQIIDALVRSLEYKGDVVDILAKYTE